MWDQVMWGQGSDQRELWEADHLYVNLVGQDSFYSRLAALRVQLFRDEDFAALYRRDSGRRSVSPQPASHGPATAGAWPGA